MMKKSGTIFSLFFLIILFQPVLVLANPVGGVVTSGNAEITNPSPDTVQVNQSSHKAIINWQSFNIQRGQTTRFVQPNSSSVTLNRINPNFGASEIFGNLVANGQVWLINPSGIVFGKSARVNVGGLLATTSDIKDEDFMAGRYKFKEDPNFSEGKIVNRGIIQAKPGGLVALVGNKVENRGIIQAKLGTVVMGGAQAYTLDFDGDQLINFVVHKGVKEASSENVKNSGIIDVSSHAVALTNSSAKKLMVDAINMAGVEEATGVSTTEGGAIILHAGDGGVKVSNKVVATGGKVKVEGKTVEVAQAKISTSDTENAGKIEIVGHDDLKIIESEIDAAGLGENKGGTIHLLGSNEILIEDSIIQASGNYGGGEILIGGDYQGQGETITSQYTIVDPLTLIEANALLEGDGGRVILWADKGTAFFGEINTKGGEVSGDGGFVEVSGKEDLIFMGYVDTTAANGEDGLLLLDPRNITVVSSGGINYSGTINFGNGGNTFVNADSLTGNVTMNANQDIIFEVDTIVEANSIALNAGRSIELYGTIITNNIVLNANHPDANQEFRAPGLANIILNGSILTTGNNAIVSVTLRSGAQDTVGTISIAGTGFFVGISGGGSVFISGGTQVFVDRGLGNSNNPFLNNNLNFAVAITTPGDIVFGSNGTIFANGNVSLVGTSISQQGNNPTVIIGSNSTVTLGPQGSVNMAAKVGTSDSPFRIRALDAANNITLAITGGSLLDGSGVYINHTIGNTLTISQGNLNNNYRIYTTGALNVTGSIFSGGNITLRADTMNISNVQIGGTANNTGFATTVSLETNSNNRTIGIAGGAGSLSLSATNLNRIRANNVRIGRSNSGDITIGAWNPGNNFATNSIILQTAGTITQTGRLNIGTRNLALRNASGVTLGINNNVIAALAGTGLSGTTTVVSNRALSIASITDDLGTIEGISTTGNLNITAGGAITQSAALNVSGVSTFAAGNNNITLNNAGNDFSTVGITSGNNVAIADINAIILGASTISGTYNVIAGGAITQSGILNVSGVSTFAAGNNNITLNNAGNNFSTVGITSGNNVSITDTNAIILGTSTISGTYNVIAGGDITQSGVLNVSGVSTFAAGSNNITLNNAGNNFSTVGITSGNNVSITDTNAIILGSSNVTGTYNITAGGNITQSGVLSIAGDSTFTVTAANSDVLLYTAANNFVVTPIFNITGQGSIRDLGLRNVAITSGLPILPPNLRNLTLEFNNAAIVLPGVSISGDLTVTAGGSITQSGVLNVSGISTFAAGSHNIILNNASNDFSNVVITNAANVTLRDINALEFGNGIAAGGQSSITGMLDVTAGGAITQSDAIRGANLIATTLNDAGAAITLINSDNDFASIALQALSTDGTSNAAGNIAYSSATDFEVAQIATAGSLELTSDGAITQVVQGGAINVVGSSVFNADSLALINTDNQFTGAVSLDIANNAALTNDGAVTLAQSTVGGDLDLTASSMSQTGAISVDGITNLQASGDIEFGNIENNFAGLTLSAANANINNGANNLVLDAVTLSGDLILSSGSLSQTAAISVAGDSLFNAGSMNLTNVNNAFAGVVALNVTNDAALTNNGALTLAQSTVGGALDLTASNMSQTGAISVDGATNLQASGDIEFGNIANNFAALTLDAVNASINNSTNSLALIGAELSGDLTLSTGALEFSNITTVGGNLDVSSSAITQAAQSAVNVTGTSLFAADSLILTNSDNTFTGAVSLDIANNAALTNDGALSLAQSTVGGDLDLTASSMSQTAAISVAGDSLFNAGSMNLTNVNNAFAGVVALNVTNDAALTNDGALTLAQSTVGGDLDLIASNMSQTGAISVVGATNLQASGDIEFGNIANNFAGLTLNAANVSINNGANNLVLDAVTLSGDLILSSGDLSQTAAISVAGDSLFNAGSMNLTNVNNAFAGVVALNVTNDAALTNEGALTLAQSTVGGDLDLTASSMSQTGGISTGGTANLQASGDIEFSNIANNFAGLTLSAANASINNGANNLVLDAVTLSGDLILSSGDLSQTAAISVAGDSLFNAGSMNLINVNNAFAGVVALNVTNDAALTNEGALTLAQSTVGGDLDLTASSMSQTGGISTGGTANLQASGDIEFGNIANNFAALTLDAVNASINNSTNFLALIGAELSGDLTLSTGALEFSNVINVGGNLDVSSSVINQALQSAVNVTGTSLFAADSLILTNSDNTFTGAVSLDIANNAALTNDGALTLAQSTVGGNLDLIASSMSQSAAISVAGDSSFNAESLDLTNVNNTFAGVVSLNVTNNAALTNDGALTLAQSTVGGNLDLTASNMSQTGGISTGGTANLQASGDIEFGNIANNFAALNIDAVNASINNGLNDLSLIGAELSGDLTLLTGALEFSNITNVGGILDVSSSAITQAAQSALHVTGASLFAADSLVLTNANNIFTGAVSLDIANNAALTNDGALTLAQSTVGGNLDLTASNMSQTGALSVDGITNLQASGDIEFGNIANNFSSINIVAANDATINDSNALNIGVANVNGNLAFTSHGALNFNNQVNVGGNLSVISNGGAISQSAQQAALNVAGDALFNAGANSISLINAANNFIGAVSLVTTGNNSVSLVNNRATILGTSVVGGAFNLISLGDITQIGNVNVNGVTTLQANGYDINLATHANNFATLSIINADNASINDINALNFDAINLAGDFTVTAGSMTQSETGIIVGGNAIFTSNVQGSDILLHSAANDFANNPVFTDNGNIRDLGLRNINANAQVPVMPEGLRNLTLIFDNSAMILPELSVSNSINLTAGGSITQVGVIEAQSFASSSQGGLYLDSFDNKLATFAASNTAGGDISLTNAYDNHTGLILGAIVTDGGNVSIVNSGAIVLAGGTAINSGMSGFGISNIQGITTNGGNVSLVSLSNDQFVRPITINAPIITGGGSVIVDAANPNEMNASIIVNALIDSSGEEGQGTLFVGSGVVLNVEPILGIGDITLRGNGFVPPVPPAAPVVDTRLNLDNFAVIITGIIQYIHEGAMLFDSNITDSIIARDVGRAMYVTVSQGVIELSYNRPYSDIANQVLGRTGTLGFANIGRLIAGVFGTRGEFGGLDSSIDFDSAFENYSLDKIFMGNKPEFNYYANTIVENTQIFSNSYLYGVALLLFVTLMGLTGVRLSKRLK